MTDPDLDPERRTRLHRALRSLPVPRAPQTLLPRVLAATARPGHVLSHGAWPASWQAAAVAVVLLLALAAWAWLPPMVAASDAARAADAGATLARVLWRLLLQPALDWVFLLLVASTLASSAAWTALTRIAFRGALP